LRQKLSLPEVLLWVQIKGRKLDGLHFRRQHPLGPYILDFYCDEAKLCVEVDGYSHGTANRPERDKARDAFLAGIGVRTLRLSASTVLDSVDAAMSTILVAARHRGAPPLGELSATPTEGD
jgi:very-short-patch-repair endonuclease